VTRRPLRKTIKLMGEKPHLATALAPVLSQALLTVLAGPASPAPAPSTPAPRNVGTPAAGSATPIDLLGNILGAFQMPSPAPAASTPSLFTHHSDDSMDYYDTDIDGVEVSASPAAPTNTPVVPSSTPVAPVLTPSSFSPIVPVPAAEPALEPVTVVPCSVPPPTDAAPDVISIPAGVSITGADHAAANAAAPVPEASDIAPHILHHDNFKRLLEFGYAPDLAATALEQAGLENLHAALDLLSA